MPRPTIRPAGRLTLLLAGVVAASGCYRYVPMDPEAAPPGQGVRVMMTRQGATELASVTDVDQSAPLVNGTVMGVEGDDLLLQVPVAPRQEAFVGPRIKQTVRVPRGEIITFERREIDGVATGLVVGAGAALAAVVVAFIIDPFGRGDSGDPDPPDELALTRFDLFTISLGR